LLRRRRSSERRSRLRFADLSLDLESREVLRGRRALELTPTEFRLLELLLRNAQRVLDRSEIFTHVWGCDLDSTSNSLNVQMVNLRRKIGEPQLLHTVRGVGYVLREPRA
jgi:two-component system response regulator MprA